MSELIDTSRKRVDTLKALIVGLHRGSPVDDARKQLEELLGLVPYGEVVQAEQELVAEGLPETEIVQYCDLHSAALRGKIAQGPGRPVPPGHPVHTFREENKAIASQLERLRSILEEISRDEATSPAEEAVLRTRSMFNMLMDIEKHYARKENLLFPFLERHGITAPPAVMWGKHDEIRAFLRSVQQALQDVRDLTMGDLRELSEILLAPTVNAIDEMIHKEEAILFPMCLDTLTETEWYDVYTQSEEIGYCLYEPRATWEPAGAVKAEPRWPDRGRIQLSTGSLSIEELEAVLRTLPVDLTFVDKDDRVRYYTLGRERVFERNRAILGRQVQYCHPPSSVHVVERILSDFKSGKQSAAKFWIHFRGRSVHIAYYAVRDEGGNYLGTLEVTQDIGEYKRLEGERRILSYDVIGQVPLSELISKMRQAVNQDELILEEQAKEEVGKPDWARRENVRVEYSAIQDLERGIHPINRVMKEIQILGDNEVYLLVTNFIPAPLIALVEQRGFEAYVDPMPGGTYGTYIRKGGTVS